MAIELVSTTPSSGVTDYFINKSIELTYNQSISTVSLTDNVIFLIDLSTNEHVPISISLKPTDASTIVIVSSVNLKENTNYRLIVIGADQGLGYYLQSEALDQLSITTVLVFSTGDSVYHIDTTIEKQASNLSLEGDLFLPSNIKALGYEFTIEKVRPLNHTHEVPLALNGSNAIRFSFTKPLMTGADYDSWANVEAYPILQDSQYLGAGVTSDPDNPIPGYTVSIDNKDLVIEFSQSLPQNVSVSIDLNSSITSIDGDEYGGAMKYMINTELSVNAFGPKMVKLELASISDQLYDDYIGALLFKNSIFLWEKTGRSISLESLSFPAKKYVLLATLLDIMEDKDYHKFVVAGTRRQLGDLNVSVDNMVGRLALKIARVQKEKDIALESLFKGWQFKAIPASALASQSRGDRLWYDINTRYTDSNYKYYQWNLPVSNIYINRQAKTNNPFW